MKYFLLFLLLFFIGCSDNKIETRKDVVVYFLDGTTMTVENACICNTSGERVYIYEYNRECTYVPFNVIKYVEGVNVELSND